MKEKVSRKSSKPRHKPLGDEIEAEGRIKTRYRKRPTGDEIADAAEAELGAASSVVQADLSRKILIQAREQQDEEEQRRHHHGYSNSSSGGGGGGGRGGSSAAAAAARGGDVGIGMTAEEFEDEGEWAAGGDAISAEASYASLGVDAGDEAALRLFMNPGGGGATRTINLADMIMDKIREKQTEIQSRLSEAAADASPMPPLDPRVIEVYRGVGHVLSKYRSGKFPKAFKIIPNLKNWEEVLYVTEPDSWSAAAMYQATRTFASNLSAKLAQRFFNLVLLPRVRDDILEFKRLNFHLFMALKKALFKPAAFFKGILLPLAEAGDCSLREAVIVGSVVVRTSIPVLHSAAAMLKLAEMDYSGATSIFLRILLDKKYALPYRVVDAVVHHFYRFTHDERELPVLWHQCLLVFVQRYKTDITLEQKEALMELLRAKTHFQITPEIRREIVMSISRDSDEPMQAHVEGEGAMEWD
eukprot:UC1_evm2s337